MRGLRTLGGIFRIRRRAADLSYERKIADADGRLWMLFLDGRSSITKYFENCKLFGFLSAVKCH